MNNTPILYNEYNVLHYYNFDEFGFYVYVLLDQTKPGTYTYGNYIFEYEPYYVGKGSKSRVFDHFRALGAESFDAFNLSNKDNNLCKKITYNIWYVTSQKPLYVIIEKNLTQQEALKLEEKLIYQIGIRIGKEGVLFGPLTNLQLKGSANWDKESLSKIKITPELLEKEILRRQKISKANKGKIVPKYAVEKSRQSLKNFYKTHSVWNKGIPHTKEVCEKISKFQKEYFSTHKGRPRSEKEKENLSKRQTGLYNSNKNVSIWFLEEKSTFKIFVLKGGIKPFLKSFNETKAVFDRKINSKFTLLERVPINTLSNSIVDSFKEKENLDIFIKNILIKKGLSEREIVYFN